MHASIESRAEGADSSRLASMAGTDLFPKPQRELQWIPVHLAHGKEAKPTKAFVASVARYGVITPILVSRQPDGSYRVRAGRRRLAAAVAAKLPSVPAMVIDETEDGSASAAYTIVENLHRSRNVASELRALTTLARDGASEDDLEAMLGLPKRDFNKLLKLLDLLPGFVEILEAGLMSPTTAAIVARLARRDQSVLLECVDAGKRVTLEAARAFRLKTQYSATQLSFLTQVTPDVEVPKWR